MLWALHLLLQTYLAALAARPLLVKGLTSSALAAASDAIAQRLLGARHLSIRRCLVMALYGGSWYAPTNHCWQALLASLFPTPAGGAGLLAALMRLAQRVAADQLLYAPLNNAATILYVALAADRRSWPAARAKLAAELPGVQRRGWRLWPFVQLINQSLVPLELRVLVNSAVSLVWTAHVIARARRQRGVKLVRSLQDMQAARLPHAHNL